MMLNPNNAYLDKAYPNNTYPDNAYLGYHKMYPDKSRKRGLV